MTQRGKSLLIVGLALACIMVILFATSRFILVRSFTSLEEQHASKNIERAAIALRDDIANLSTLAGDYSGWDEAYRFVREGNQDFVRINLAEAIYPKLHLNLVIFLNNEGGIVYARAFDHERNIPLPAYRSFLPHIAPGSLLLSHANPESLHKGLIMLPEGPLLVASRPVLTSEYKGPVRGTLIMGRLLDKGEIQRLSETTRLPIEFFPFDASGPAPDLAAARRALSAGTPSMVRQRSGESIAGYSLFRDIYGKPALLTRIDMPSDILRKGEDTIRYFMFWFVCLSLLVFACSHIFISRFIVAKQKREETENRYRVLVEQAAEGIVLAEPRGLGLMEANGAFRRLLGYAPGERLPQTMGELVAEGGGPLDSHVQRAISGRRTIRFEVRLMRKDRSTAFAEMSVAVIATAGKEVLSFVVHDITERKRFEEELVYQAYHDSLTGLPNRSILLDRLNHALSFGGRFKNKPLGVLLLDLDNFKLVNDTMGHAAGDQLLLSVAERLRASMRRYDTVARIGGDEFVVILTEIADSREVATVAEKLLQLFSEPFGMEGKEVHVTASIGIAINPQDGDSADTLLRNADTAMYHAKERGKNSYKFFSAEMNRRMSERLVLETRLRRALERGEFLLHYQPRVDLSSGRIVGAEALIRWNDSEGEQMGPHGFIPLLDETGLIIPVGEWVLRTACEQAREWQEAGYPPLHIAVNLSARQFHRQDLADTVERLIGETGLDPRYLSLELTEGTLMQDVEETCEKLTALKDLGLRLSVDDFGTGYSSLSNLKRFPLDELKIDRSFVRDLTKDPDDAAIVATIIAMARSLKLKVVAEGVETAEQLSFLSRNRCEEIQGYYFSKPLPAAGFEEFLREKGARM